MTSERLDGRKYDLESDFENREATGEILDTIDECRRGIGLGGLKRHWKRGVLLYSKRGI